MFSTTEKIFNYNDKKKLVYRIQNLKNKKLYIKLFKLILYENIEYTKNNNGIFFNINKLSIESLCKLDNYLDNCENNKINSGTNNIDSDINNIDSDTNDSDINTIDSSINENIEYHLLGNHLLENTFSLLFGAFYFKNEKLYNKSKKLLKTQLNEQILEDGGHFELSPMYHQIMLFRVLDCIQLVKLNSWKNDDLLNLLKVSSSKMFKTGSGQSNPLVSNVTIFIL